jgi:hypothetical protein
MMTSEPFARLAAYAEDSPRIKQLVETNQNKLATDQLVTRMNDVMNGFIEGDAIEDLSVFEALTQINKWRGPASYFMMSTMAARQIEIMTLEFMMRNEG